LEQVAAAERRDAGIVDEAIGHADRADDVVE
jgi:hypothetical protein